MSAQYEKNGSAASILAPVLSAKAVFRRFWPIARLERRWLIVGGLLLVASAACDTAAIWMFSVITDRVLTAGNLAAFWTPAVEWVALTLISGVLVFGGQYLTARAGERFLLRLRGRVFAHVQRLSPDFFESRKHGDLVARLSADVESVEALVNSGVVQAAISLLTVVFYAAGALLLRWELALVSFAAVPAFVLVAKKSSRRVNAIAREERASHGELVAVLEEGLANITLTQTCNRQGTEEQRVHEHGARWMRAKLTLVRLSALYSPVVHLLETICVLCVIGFGAWEITQHRLTLGGLFAFAAFLGYLYPPVQALGSLTMTVAAASTGAARLIELLDTEPTVADTPRSWALRAARGELRLESVSFGYPGAARAVLRDFSLTVHPGELVALTGASGAGKTTIAKLLLRFTEPTAGVIRLDGVDIRDLTLSSLRAAVTLLPQETLIFHGTIGENIAYGRQNATREQIVAAAEAADAHEFIMGLPDGYDTVIGQRGHGVSGGQRQRIGIARAMIADAPILVLDEPTANLDASSARRIAEPLRRLAGGRTTILITHDLDLAALADRIIVLGDVQGARGPKQAVAAPRIGTKRHSRLAS
ncbi:ABC transporter ATP-binding protein [Amycolatopsis pithecellobii]|uniref:ATP-binding cassette domain-containing protein n=1 Tax=Amycolatopsis pithecellobii TaxID=664692 RepID=A0A6N7Z777_9PSEU|nr:ABC transporter ATP-binding protein [Amycolatopsis pithecellobii]MTD57989.1 ATP-binding cassette domain-containing protein [Amycolatopsis pithecellobii]